MTTTTEVYGTIYGIYHPDTGELRYIGQTKNSLNKRLSSHISAASMKFHSKLYRWIGGLLKKDKRPIIKALITASSLEELNTLEFEYIKNHRDLGFRLLNMADGGGGNPGHVVTEDMKKRMSEAQIGIPKQPHTDEWRSYMSMIMTGRPSPNPQEHHDRLNEMKRGVPRSEETRAKISASKTGSTASDETRAKMSASHKGKKKTAEHIANQTGKKHGRFRQDLDSNLLVQLHESGMNYSDIARHLSLPNGSGKKIVRDRIIAVRSGKLNQI